MRIAVAVVALLLMACDRQPTPKLQVVLMDPAEYEWVSECMKRLEYGRAMRACRNRWTDLQAARGPS